MVIFLFDSKKTIPQPFHYLILEVRFQKVCLQLSTSLELFSEYFNVEETLSLCPTTISFINRNVSSVAKFQHDKLCIHSARILYDFWILPFSTRTPTLVHTYFFYPFEDTEHTPFSFSDLFQTSLSENSI